MKPKKLIRSRIVEHLQPDEYEHITDRKELNALYALKIQEELVEIQASDHKDIMEFADLWDVVEEFAKQNGFSVMTLISASLEKQAKKGSFGTLVLNNLNPENPSNALYFKNLNQ